MIWRRQAIKTKRGYREIMVGERRRKKVARGPKHGSDGRLQIGEREVDDPLEPGAKARAIVNVRESAIDHMFSRKRINISQKEAGDRLRKIWEQAAIGRPGALDPAKEFVDGGIPGDPLSDGLVWAAKELEDALRVGGPVGSQFLISIVCEGKRIEDVAAQWSRQGGNVRGKYAQGYVSGRLIEALDDLVKLWRLEAVGSPVRQERSYLRNGAPVTVYDGIRGPGEPHTGPAKEWGVGWLGDLVEKGRRPLDRGRLMAHTSGNMGHRARVK